jgi:hypothetical protein
MVLTRKNPKAGRELKSFPLDTDEASGQFGYKVGYISCAKCEHSEKVVIRISEATEVANAFAQGVLAWEKRFKLVQEDMKKKTFKEKIAERLLKIINKEEYQRLKELEQAS